MPQYPQNPYLNNPPLPVDIVFHPSWWNRHTGITFDEDFFYHPLKRVESERQMEKELYDRFGRHGLGQDRDKDLPLIGAVHNAAGYILSEMLGCKVLYEEASAPQVVPLEQESLHVSARNALKSPAYRRFEALQDQLKKKYGYLTGDINWGGILNIALDLAGEQVFLDFFMKTDATRQQFMEIAGLIEQFVDTFSRETGSSSISVNRNVRNMGLPVFLHSECSHTMISTEHYEEFLLPVDLAWSKKYRPFGIHYCGNDPHRFAQSFAMIENLDFLDLGWGGDVEELRKHLPHTFFNLRLDPVTINQCSPSELEAIIIRLVRASGNPYLTGVCCINMDDQVDDNKIHTLFDTVEQLKKEYLEPNS